MIDERMLMALRAGGERTLLRSRIEEYLGFHLREGNLSAAATGLRALHDLDPKAFASLWSTLKAIPGLVEACGPALSWAVSRLAPDTDPWIPSKWTSLPAWLPAEGGTTPERRFPEVLEIRETGDGEPVDFRFGLRCPWCGGEHAATVRRTLLFLRDYSCPSCEGPLRLDGRELRRRLPRVSESPKLARFEDRLQDLWHELHRAEGKHPPEAHLLCQSFTSHVTRIASASFSSEGTSA